MSKSPEGVWITGIGCVSPHGRGVPALWNGLLDGKSAFSPLTLFDASMFRNPLAGIVKDYACTEGKPARAFQMLDDAADEALSDALGLEAPFPATGASDSRIKAALSDDEGFKHAAIIAGTNFGGMSAAESALTCAAGGDLGGYLFGAASLGLGARFNMSGPKMNLSLSCASGSAAIGLAFDMIRRGRAEVALACGYDELSLYVYAGLSALRAITPETIRPFDRRRKGTLFSEGAGVMVLESAEHAQNRNAKKVYARILGRAMNNDAYHMTAPEQDAIGIQALMRAALSDAEIGPDAIQHLNLHATGTPYNDAIETKAVHAVFGARGREIPVCSVKSSTGHCMGAAGIIESIAGVLSIRDGKIPPILGLEAAEKDPLCDLLTPLDKPFTGTFDTILKTSYGFGGTNAAVVLARP